MYFNATDFDKAQDMYVKALETDKDHEEANMRLAQIYAIRGFIKKAITQNYEVVRILEAHGQTDRALRVASQTQGLNPEDDRIRKKLILIYKRLNEEHNFVAECLGLSQVYLEKGQENDAVKLLKKVIEDHPENGELGVGLAELYMRIGHLNEASEQFRRVGAHFLKSGFKKEAADAFRKLKLLGSADQNIIMTLGNLDIELGNLDAAESAFRDALKLDINNADALTGLGRVCYEKGAYRDAMLAFSKIVKINTRDIKAKEKLADLQNLTGNKPLAAKSYIEIAMHYQGEGDIERALELFKKALEMEPGNTTASREITALEKLIL